MSEPTYTIKFASNAKETDVSTHSRDVLKEIMKAADIYNVTISSTARDSYNQARVMYNNLVTHGAEHQKKLYGKSGDAVIDVYSKANKDKKDRNATISLMKAKIVAIGPRKVSKHAVDTNVLNVFDIAPSSIPSEKKKKWESAIEVSTKVSNYIFPPGDPGYHFEIEQPTAGAKQHA